MPDANHAALDFLEKRRSRPHRTLGAPVPGKDELMKLLKVAARTPDHGKLEPWRFIVLEKAAMQRLSETVAARGEELGIFEGKITKMKDQLAGAEMAVAVVASPKPSETIPEVEQTLSAGAVAMQLVNAALAAGWGANWLSGWASHDKAWREAQLGLMPHEWLAGFIHLGTANAVPSDRPRPDLDKIVEWIDA